MTAQFSSTVPSGNVPDLFPCANRIKMPQIGSEYTYLKAEKPTIKSVSLLQPFDNTTGPVEDRYVKKISADLSFTEDVVRERCFHMLPYDEKYLWEALDIGDLVPKPPTTKNPIGRHNTRGSDIRHVPCSISKGKKPLKPLKAAITKKALMLHQQAVESEESKSMESEPQKKKDEKPKTAETDQSKQTESVFMTEISDDRKEKDEKETVTSKLSDGQSGKLTPGRAEWDSYLLSIMSPLTANWVVHERMSPSEERDNLSKVLVDWYGPISHTDLVRDDDSETEFDHELQKKDEEPNESKDLSKMTFLEKVKAKSLGKAQDPYCEDSTAPFYRQPAGVRRQFKNVEKEEAGAINSTAHNITMKLYEPPKLPTLRDFVNPAVGSYLYDTNNMYQQELLTGCKQVHQADEESKIVMESHNKYQKHLRKEYPFVPEHWYPKTDSEKLQAGPKDVRHITTIKKGPKRWTSLPDPVDDTYEILNVAPPGYDPEFHRSPDPKTRRVIKQNTSLMQIISEWRAKWHLSGQFADSNTKDLIRDMTDIQPHVRLKAIATAGKAAEYKPPVEQGIQLEYEERRTSTIDEDIFLALECLLDDENDRVRKASAITLYSLNRPSSKAEEILRVTLLGQNTLDRWAAAQCLAHFGVCDSDIVGEIIDQLLSTEESIKHEQGINLLAKISNNSTLVHCLVAEQLNSSSWRHRVIACKILPTLHGSINRDLTQKLSELMWNDWHAEVRRAAAQCLGKTQHGRDVHNDLRNRILTGNERVRLEAISRIGQLGIMTAKLLPAFLKCFDDPYMSIRLETCITSGNLHIQDERVVEKLIQLATYDAVWKVKTTAIQALGKVGVKSEEIFECLLWALRYEDMPGVRAEACHSLVLLGWHEDEMVEVMQERLLVETSQPVRDEMFDALCSFGVNATEDMDMVAQIKAEVRKLCTRNVIATKIMTDEMDETRRENLSRMICESDKEIQDHKAKTESIFEKMQSTRPGVNKSDNYPGTPGLSRESIVFTPSADKELEDILSRESDGISPDNLTVSSLGTKSRSASCKSGSSSTSKLSSGKSGDDSTYYSEKEQNANSEIPLTGSSLIPVLEVSEARPSSNLSTLPGMQSHSKVDMTPSQSVEDIGRMSRMSMGRTSERKALLSRETQMEKDKISAVSVSTYLGLDARYSNMLPLLSQLDAGLSALDSSKNPVQNDTGVATTKSLDSAVKSTQGDSTERMDVAEYEALKQLLENFESVVQNQNISEDGQSEGSENVKSESSDLASELVDGGESQQLVEGDHVKESIPTIVMTQQSQDTEVLEMGDKIPAIVIDKASDVDSSELSSVDHPLDDTTSTDNVELSNSDSKSKYEDLQDPNMAEQEKKYGQAVDTAHSQLEADDNGKMTVESNVESAEAIAEASVEYDESNTESAVTNVASAETIAESTEVIAESAEVIAESGEVIAESAEASVGSAEANAELVEDRVEADKYTAEIN